MFNSIVKLTHILTRRELLHLGILLLATLAMAFSQAVGVASVMPFIGMVVEPEAIFENQWTLWVYDTLNFSSTGAFIVFTGIVMFTLILLANAISALSTWLQLKFAWMNNHRLSRRLLEKYLSMPYPFFLNQNSAVLSKNVLAEVNSLTESYLMSLLTIFSRSLVALFIIFMLFFVNLKVSLVAILLLGGSYTVIFLLINRRLKERGANRFHANHMRFKTVDEAFGGIKEVKVANRESFFLENYSRESLKHARLLSWNGVVEQLPRYALEAIAFGGIIIFVLVLLVTQEDARQVFPLASLFAFAGYRLMPALQHIFGSFAHMQFNRTVLDRIYEDITRGENKSQSLAAARKQQPHSSPLTFSESIGLKDVSYTYPNSRYPAIEEINVTIKRDSSVAFVGPTGVGKTTLVDIILGLLPPEKGFVLVDGVPLHEGNRVNWQKNIGYVPQQIYLSDDTVARNIAFGVPDEEICQWALEHAAGAAKIYDFILDELPAGFHTVVGERGIRLSGGQRQRIGIARALYHNPDVLVFDEATSALDGVTEEAVLDAMENAARQKTMIIIAHRLTTVKNCEMIYLLENKRISASGTYEELLANSATFKAMAKGS